MKNITKNITLLGIDPGLRKTGFGVISGISSNIKYNASGTIKTNEKECDALRLREIFFSISEIIDEFKPCHAVIEKVFFNKNPKSTLSLGQARGVAIVAISTKNIPIFEISSTEIKKAIVGNGHAAKSQVQFMVKTLLKLDKVAEPDSSDALACALAFKQMRIFND